MATSTARLLEIIARSHPELYEILHPHVPFVLLGGFVSRAAEVELNPQPIPPGRASRAADELNPQPLPPREVRVAAVELVAQLALNAINAHGQKRNGAELLVAEIDDWCGTHPRPIPWPPNWPWPWPPGPDPDPEPHPWLTAEMFAVAAVTLAGIGSRIADTTLRGGFDTAAEHLADAAVGAIEG
ncbi:hypothetical protein M6D93_02555 [Jatrophihabitans telluris]|uniref:Uncharacterized protein n=1 Tax=Jatrophihabitans telluris TaxID=2038343 RepID=A0ABY4QZL7_9ACTN|nr:hypothetical protein [Jatrophihabitans telluris]UQX88889.1 hypothetical protein M6D93_02555 [Jatrophihabitans telluris]